ncbi:hypothetical protein Taro_032570 [Colocasia esculenta]|uniref:Peptidase A1 domain-containing protein n=1 Tax=Colocasia esculenta TaxID=4460 RepID=A0A843VSZ6_COLES|nr:hypothetical protein [Colocasia esculenta]
MAILLSRSIILSLLLSSVLYAIQVVHGDEHFQDVAVDSLKTAAVCSAPKGHGPNTLKIIHRHGPCSTLGGIKPDHHQALAQDSLRVASLQSRASGRPNATLQLTTEASLPLQRGTYLGTGNYVVTFGLGTPTRSQTVVMDTGSDVCWVQCRPCLRSCYRQQEPVFNPSTSSTYRKIPCASATCKKQVYGGSCSGRYCAYSVHYGDNSSTAGFLSADKLTVTPTNVFPSFVFGCGQNNQGLFGRAAGLFGLARSPYSLVSQTASRFGNAFSYCLPQSNSGIGQLRLGRSSARSALYTPMLTNRLAPVFYFLDLIGISVGGVRLAVPPTVFRAGGTIIDSGTVITRLPPAAYAALRLAFRSGMSQYPLAQPVSLLDTCYDFTSYSNVQHPLVTLHFRGVDLKLRSAGVFYFLDISRVCLAFAGNTDPRDVGIIGNTQQRTLEVIYDVGAQRIGFAAGTCG